MEMNRVLLTAHSVASTSQSSSEVYSHPSPMSELDEDVEIQVSNDQHDCISQISNPSGLIIIDTAFDPELSSNKTFPCHGMSKREIFDWTEKQRSIADNAAIIPNNLKELESMVSYYTSMFEIPLFIK